jgi:site-specific DNA-methyltransferase (adenine-specific)
VGRVNYGHPTEKPLELITWSLEQSRTSGTVLDPYMGSGTTLRAAKDLGRKAIGIEIEEKYCAIAVERLRQAVLPL